MAPVPEVDLEVWARDQRAFISSVMAEFRQERAALAQELRGIGITPVLFEEFGGRDADPEAAYLEEVRSSDIYLGLLGVRYGRPAADGFSATHAEFLEAEEAGPISGWAKEVDDREDHEQSFLTEMQTFHTTGTFFSTEELVEGVVRRLREIGTAELSPWVKLVTSSSAAAGSVAEIRVEADVRDPDVLGSLRGSASGMLGGQVQSLVAGDIVRRARLVEMAEENTSSSRTRVSLTFRDEGEPPPDTMADVSYSSGTQTWSPGEIVEAEVRGWFGHGDTPHPHPAWGPIPDPFERLRGRGIGEESLRPIARLMLTEALVGTGRAERIVVFRLGARQPTGRRRVRIRWRDRRRPANAEPEEREVNGDIDL